MKKAAAMRTAVSAGCVNVTKARLGLAGMVFCLSVAFAGGGTLHFGQLPPPVFADTEMSTNCPLPEWSQRTAKFECALSFTATPSNNVELAFGRDTDSDGSLSPGETELIIGWDCGQWIVKALSPEWLEYGETVSAGWKDFRLSAGLDRTGGIQTLALTDGAVPVFSNLPAPMRARLLSKDWNFVRFTARGVGRPEGGPQVSLTERGITFLLR